MFDRRPLALDPEASIALASSGDAYCLVEGGVVPLGAGGADVARVLREVVRLVDGSRSADDIVLALGSDDSEVARGVIAALREAGVVHPRPFEPRKRDESLVILGNHALFGAIDAASAEAGWAKRSRIEVRSFACVEAGHDRALDAPSKRTPGPSDRSLEHATIEELTALLADFDYAVCAIEGEPYQALLDVNRAALAAGTSCLFVTTGVVGPRVFGRAGPCFECWLRGAYDAADSAPWLRAPLGPTDEALLREVSRLAVSRISAPDAAARVVRLGDGGRWTEPLLSHGACAACRAGADEPLSSAVASVIEIGRAWLESPTSRVAPHPDAYRTVGIVGGGTAGYLTALALRRHRPELDVTLIESSAIPVIGVGEATTPELVRMLHSPHFLGRDILDFYERVRPTWKLGIKFQFGPRDFTFPFQRGRLLESKVYDGHLDHQSFAAMLMAADRGPVVRDEEGRVTSLAHTMRWAYHLENRRFVRYLDEEARAAGVKHVDAKIAEVRKSPNGEEVAELVTDDGRRLAFDLYVDCSGFRSLLMESALGSPYYDWSSTLFTDRAVAATVPHDGTVKPYTLAETMDAGWCWNIPFEDEDHRGYVFASNAISADQAEAEMRAKNPGMGAAALVRFRSGRHEHFWKGNVIALGNAYGFVEPLESTAIHMVVLTLENLTTHFPTSRHDRAVPESLNRKVGQRWDAIRWFLGTHYRFNRRLDTPFWRAANNGVNIEGALERVALFRERAPLSYRTSLFYTVVPPEFFSDDHSFDTMLMGLDVGAHYIEPFEDRQTWNRRTATLQRALSGALPQAEAIAWLRANPEELNRLASDRTSWLHRSIHA
jgi:tryptophan 7-halogenase